MAKARLPQHTSDAWDCGFLLDPARPVRAVDGRGGLVVAGGEQMFMLRPGAQNYQFRDPPDPGTIAVIAAEARAPWRYAISAGEQVTLFLKNKTEDAIVRLRSAAADASATHLAWAKAGTGSALYIRWDDGAIVKTNPEMTGVEVLEFEWIDAVASDAAGALALAVFDDGHCTLYRSEDGERLRFDQHDFAADSDAHMHLAVAGEAVAVSVDDGVWVSRKVGEPLARCEALDQGGAMAFQGTSSDAALFGTIRTKTLTAIVRVDAEGTATRIAEFESSSDLVPEITSLTWDATRKTLWAASPEMGIISCIAPGGRKGKKTLAS